MLFTGPGAGVGHHTEHLEHEVGRDDRSVTSGVDRGAKLIHIATDKIETA